MFDSDFIRYYMKLIPSFKNVIYLNNKMYNKNNKEYKYNICLKLLIVSGIGSLLLIVRYD